MSITTALKARREQLRDREAGFTLIELLVVVIIIGILAAIAIPVYIGVQNSAKDSAATSDLANLKTAEVAYFAQNNAYTTDLTSAGLGNFGYTASSGNTAAPSVTSASGTAFCAKATSGSSKVFYITATTSASTTACS